MQQVGVGAPRNTMCCMQVSEAALCIAFDKSKLPGAAGGIFTPATGMGNALVKRLEEDLRASQAIGCCCCITG